MKKKIIIMISFVLIIIGLVSCGKESNVKEEDLGSGIIFTKATEDMKDHYILNLNGKNYELKTDEHNSFSTSTFYKNNLYYDKKNSNGYCDLIKFNINTKKSEVLAISKEVDNIDILQSTGSILFLRVVKKGEHSIGLVKYNMDTDEYSFFDYDNSDDILVDFDVRGKYIVEVKYSDNEMQKEMGNYNLNKSQNKVFKSPKHRISVMNIDTGEKIYEDSIDEMVESITINNEGNKIAYIHSPMDGKSGALEIVEIKEKNKGTASINKGNYVALRHVRFGNDDSELYYIAETGESRNSDDNDAFNVTDVIKYSLIEDKIVESISTKNGLFKYYTLLPSVRGDKELFEQYLKEEEIEFNENKMNDTNLNSTSEENEPVAFVEKGLKTSDIPVIYTLEKSKSNKDYIKLFDEDISFNKEKLDEFLKSVEKKQPSKIRYTQYYEGILDKMRDVEYNGELIILKEYDTKSNEEKTYKYIETSDDSIIVEDSYYKLKNGKDKLFPIS